MFKEFYLRRYHYKKKYCRKRHYRRCHCYMLQYYLINFNTNENMHINKLKYSRSFELKNEVIQIRLQTERG